MGVGELVKFQVVRVCQVSNLGLVPAVNVQNSVREFLVGMLELGNDASRSQYAGKSFEIGAGDVYDRVRFSAFGEAGRGTRGDEVCLARSPQDRQRSRPSRSRDGTTLVRCVPGPPGCA